MDIIYGIEAAAARCAHMYNNARVNTTNVARAIKKEWIAALRVHREERYVAAAAAKIDAIELAMRLGCLVH